MAKPNYFYQTFDTACLQVWQILTDSIQTCGYQKDTNRKKTDKDNKNNDTHLHNVWNNIKRRAGKKEKKRLFDLPTNTIREIFRINMEDISSDKNKTHEADQN